MLNRKSSEICSFCGDENEEDLRCLEGLRELVAKLAPRVDGEDARDWDPDGAVRKDVLQKVERQF